MKAIYLIFILALFANHVFAEFDKEAAAIIEPLSKKYGDMMLNGEWDELSQCYDKDIVLMPPMTKPYIGIEELKQEFKKLKRMGVKYRSLSGDIKEIWQCNDLIYERGTLAFSQSTHENPKPIAVYGSYFSMWKKQKNGEYKMRISIWNLDFNPWEN